ncbi:MAG: hypothetical protein FJ404_13975 [Verrucomicrobia bacterium]|nr:hypothetical protein [Verrucomicrobiota bacterium]
MEKESHHESPRRLGSLLKWKRHEQPPPGYFSSFSHGVLAEIQFPSEPPSSPWASWWNQVAGPALACSYGLMLGGILFIGLAASQSAHDAHPSSFVQHWAILGSQSPPRMPALETRDNPVLLGSASLSSLSPVIDSGPIGFMFEDRPSPIARVSFSPR